MHFTDEEKHILNSLLLRKTDEEKKLIIDYFKGVFYNKNNSQYTLVRNILQELKDYQEGIMPKSSISDLIKPGIDKSREEIEEDNKLKICLNSDERNILSNYMKGYEDIDLNISRIIKKLFVIYNLILYFNSYIISEERKKDIILLCSYRLGRREINFLNDYFNKSDDSNIEAMNLLEDLENRIKLISILNSNSRYIFHLSKLSSEKVGIYVKAMDLIVKKINSMNGVDFKEFIGKIMFKYSEAAKLEVYLKLLINECCQELGINLNDVYNR